eukprot:maker-scaffold103_size370364-snap-gene-1.19 protein:Tk07514 transcript:maker-scaffold103_size370364-snap-gene-1.19-mRNA-1 annotation:"heparin-binding growth factor 1"
MSCGDCCDWLLDLVFRYEEENQLVDIIAKGEDEKRIREGNRTKENIRDSPVPTDPHLRPYKKQRMKQLFNKHGYNLAIFQNGRVRGVREAFHPNAVLEVIAINVGEVQLRGVETGIYLAMTEEGKLFGEPDPTQESTVFLESTHHSYLIYLSKKYSHMGWHVGLKRNGEAKNGKLTLHPWGQKAILFSPRVAFAEHHPLRLIQNRHGYHLTIHQDGSVSGTKEDFDKFSVLEFTPSDPPGAFRIRGVESDLYLAMNDKGCLYGEKNRQIQGTLFQEHAQGRYFIYLNVHWAHLGWHIGIKKAGEAKNGKKTWRPSGQKAIQFIHKFPFRANGPQDPRAFGDQNVPPLAFIDEDVLERENGEGF